jgi:hypothetical protein
MEADPVMLRLESNTWALLQLLMAYVGAIGRFCVAYLFLENEKLRRCPPHPLVNSCGRTLTPLPLRSRKLY